MGLLLARLVSSTVVHRPFERLLIRAAARFVNVFDLAWMSGRPTMSNHHIRGKALAPASLLTGVALRAKPITEQR